jgi:uncharacterized SAM-dependent methyltransferase
MATPCSVTGLVDQFELETAQAGLRVESWWTDRAGDFAVALLLRDASLGS